MVGVRSNNTAQELDTDVHEAHQTHRAAPEKMETQRKLLLAMAIKGACHHQLCRCQALLKGVPDFIPAECLKSLLKSKMAVLLRLQSQGGIKDCVNHEVLGDTGDGYITQACK